MQAIDAGFKALRTAGPTAMVALWTSGLTMDQKASAGSGPTVKLSWLPSGYVAKPSPPAALPEDEKLEGAILDATSYAFLVCPCLPYNNIIFTAALLFSAIFRPSLPPALVLILPSFLHYLTSDQMC